MGALMQEQFAEATIATACKELRLPAVARDATRQAEQAQRQGSSPLVYLANLLQGEVEQRRLRRAQRYLKEANFPVVKTLDGFDFARSPHLPQGRILQLAAGDYIKQAEPILLIGEPGTGKTHLACALGAAAAEQGYRVRFVTAARLVTQLVEARDAHELNRVVARYGNVDVLIIDELGYVPLSRSDAELLFRVLGERNELRTVVVTTNLPFSEWTSMLPDPRLCRAIVDRLTHRAHIIETGTDSLRLQDALKRQQRER
jgi:DNA replication protein DnaC